GPRQTGLLVATARDILARSDHFSPRLDVASDLALDRGTGALALLGPHLFLEPHTQELHLQLLGLLRLRRGDGGEEPARRIEGSISVVARERLLVRPLVADVLQLSHERA